GAAAEPLPPAAPESAGFSAEGLARIYRFFEREIAANRVPGAVVAIARDGKLVYYKAHGYLDKAIGEKMPLDAIFNLASMTKPMAVVGGLTLTEQGRLGLKSRLDEYFPQFAKMQVGMLPPTPDAKPEVAKAIYIHDLMRHTSGITYGSRGNTPVHKLYPSGSPDAAIAYTGPQLLDKLASLPLLYQPGTVWDYGFSIDVLGLVIEKVAGQRLGDYLKASVWDKVGMPDTAFHVPPEKRKRIARGFANDPLTGKPQPIPILDTPIKFDCAGACAFGTVADYLRFGQMLLDGGAIGGHRVLGPKTVAFMTSDHLGLNIKNQVAGTEPHRDGYGFGLGVAVRLVDGVAAVPGTPGDFTWNGAYGTAFWADPQERLVVVYGTVAPGEMRKYYREQVQDLVYGAMTELRRAR
ncbi:MAG TPA: serine hydrolase domain-containing protein, partial [Usitatibacter sp.]|nr:serine hydrolase domain-containing protein [Usitatibacter sp.]